MLVVGLFYFILCTVITLVLSGEIQGRMVNNKAENKKPILESKLWSWKVEAVKVLVGIKVNMPSQRGVS